MADRRIHGQPLRRRVFASHGDVDVMPAPQAVIHYREQAICVRRQIHADDLGLLVDNMINEPGILVCEPIVVLPPHMGGQDVIQRGDLPAPRQAEGDLEPLGMLVEHRIDDMDQGLVAVEHTVPASEQVSLEPALALMLGKDFHHAALGSQELISRFCFGVPLPRRCFEDGSEPVGQGLVGAENPEVPLILIVSNHVAEESSEDAGVLSVDSTRNGNLNGALPEIRQAQVSQQQTAVCVNVGAHASCALWSELGQLGQEPALVVEELLRPVDPEPFLELLKVLQVLVGIRKRDLVGAEGAFDSLAIDYFGTGPALGGHEDDHRPTRPAVLLAAACLHLNPVDLVDDMIECRGQQPRVQVARTRPHHQAGSRSEAHRRIHWLAVADCSHAGARTEVR